VRLANAAVTRCRQRVQQETLEHRGWKGDPLYDIRKLLLLGAERVDEQGWERIHAALRAGDPDDQVTDCWSAKEKIRSVYTTDDPDIATERLDDAIAWCTAPEAGPELRRLAKTLRRWRTEIRLYAMKRGWRGLIGATGRVCHGAPDRSRSRSR
jgi:transposase